MNAQGFCEHHAAGAVKRSRRLGQEMTLAERSLWRLLRGLDLNIRRQSPMGRYIADFACHRARLIIEIDGFHHYLADRQARDAKRDAWFESQGYRVLRFRNQEVVEDLERVVEIILGTLPPRWGKGRDGGANAIGSGEALTAPPETDLKNAAATPPLPASPPSRGRGA
jgi:very-short-patch-repair endonuclease